MDKVHQIPPLLRRWKTLIPLMLNQVKFNWKNINVSVLKNSLLNFYDLKKNID